MVEKYDYLTLRAVDVGIGFKFDTDFPKVLKFWKPASNLNRKQTFKILRMWKSASD